MLTSSLLGSHLTGDITHKPRSRLPLHSARLMITGLYSVTEIIVSISTLRSNNCLVLILWLRQWSVIFTTWILLLLKGKGKERKSIYIAPFCTKVHTKRSGMDHTVLPANNTMPAFPSWHSPDVTTNHHSNWGSRHPVAAHYSFIDPERMKGWVGLVGWPTADGLAT